MTFVKDIFAYIQLQISLYILYMQFSSFFGKNTMSMCSFDNPQCFFKQDSSLKTQGNITNVLVLIIGD